MNPTCKIAGSNRKGFALLITITLVAFLVLILVALASLTRVETRVASNAQMLSLARQNALFSLNLAIGRLQKEAGPDDKSTARSEITPLGPAFQPYLTGVWSRANTTQTPNAWLVSGDSTIPTDIGDVLDPTAGAGVFSDDASPWVFLVGDATVGTAGERVRMATRPIEIPANTFPGLTSAATVGRYAWWIGDEGIKSSASLVDPLLLPNPISYNSGGTTGDDWTDDVKRARLNQLQPVRPRLERVFPGLSPDTAAIAEQLNKIVQYSQLSLISGGPTHTDRKKDFHAVTPLAEAVLLDRFNGDNFNYLLNGTSRLRRDLSDLNASTHAGSGPTAAVKAFQQFRATMPDANKPYEAVYHPAASLPSGATSFPAFHAGPVVTEFGLRFYFSVAASGEIMLNYLVEAELWNPYDARLEMEKGASGGPEKPLSIYIDTGLPVSVKDELGGDYPGINVTKLIVNINGGATADDDDAYGILVDINEAWEPGEVRVLAGGGTLSDGGYAGSVGTGKFLAGGATKIVSMSADKVDKFDLSIRFNGAVGAPPKSIQRYYPSMTFGALNNVPNDGAYVAGYGFNLINNFYPWLMSSGGGLDVRCPYLKPNSSVEPIYPTDATKRWDTNPANNVHQSPDSTFINLPKLTLYDLPRQELLSTGDLRQMTGEKNAELGSGHAGAINQWYDRYFFSTVPRDHAWDFAGGEPLPNRYIRYISSDRAVATLDKLRSETSARFLLNRGAFNLNSTSVDAWRMMLGQQLISWKGISTAGETGGVENLDNVFWRLPHGAQQLGRSPVPADAPPPTRMWLTRVAVG